MKLKILVLLFILLNNISNSKGQQVKTETSQPSVKLKINYLSPLLGFLNTQLEVGVTPHVSINLFGGYNYRDIKIFDATLSGWLGGVECRIYTEEQKHMGLYFAPYAVHRNYTIKIVDDPERLNIQLWGLGGIGGYQFKLGNSPFVMDVFGGIEATYIYLRDLDEGFPPFGGSLRLGTTFGYRF